MVDTTKNFNQTATIWESNGLDGAGDITFTSASPREISVRWEKRTEVAYSSNSGNGSEVKVNNVVFVGEDLREGDWLYLGSSTAGDPTTVDGARRIVEFRKTPNLKGTEFTRMVML